MSGDGIRAVLCLLLLMAAVCSALISDYKGDGSGARSLTRRQTRGARARARHQQSLGGARLAARAGTRPPRQRRPRQKKCWGWCYHALSPMDPYVYIGGELVLTCNLTKRTVYQNASSMYFTWGVNDTRVDASHVSILSPTSIRLRKLVNGEQDGGAYVCWLGQASNNKNDVVAYTVVTVDYMPVAVRNVSCFVDNWDSMNCSWTLNQSFIHPTHINVSLIWAISDKQVPCPEMSTTWCIWRRDSYIPEASYNMVIIVKNLKTGYEVKSDVFTIHSWKFVKPNRVKHLKMKGSNGTCLQISWESSDRFRQFEYNVTYEVNPALKDPPLDTRTSLWLDTEATLCDLTPFTQYTVRVAAKPIPHMNRSSKKPAGFLSDWVSVEGKTKEEVPVRAPPMHPGGFVQSEISGGQERRVTLYWKPVERQYLNGQLEGYVLQYREAGSKQAHPRQTDLTKSLSADLELYRDRSYYVSIFARNNVGVSRANSSLFIPQWTGDTLNPQDVAVEVEQDNSITRFHVQWKPPAKGRVLSYTVFWCKGDRASFKCLDSVDWMPLDSSQGRAGVDISNMTETIDTYLLGVSAEVETPSAERTFSGIVWSKCNYISMEKPTAVSRIAISPYEPDGGLQVTWSGPDCLESRSYVTHYELAYCPVTPHKVCSEPLVNITVSNKKMSHVIKVEAGERYKVLVTALASAGRGPTQEEFYLYQKASDILAADSLNSVLGLTMGLLFAGIFVILGIALIMRKMLEFRKKHLPIETPAKMELQGPVGPGIDPTYEKIPILEKTASLHGVRVRSVDSETALLASEQPVDSWSSTSGKGSKGVRAAPPSVRQSSRQSSSDGYCQQNGDVADHASHASSHPHSRTLSPGSQGSVGSGYQPHDPLSAPLPPRQPEVGFRPEVMTVRPYVDPSTTFSFAKHDSAITRGSQEAVPAPRRDQSSHPIAVENIPLHHNATSTHGRRGSNPTMYYAKATPQNRPQDSLHAVGNARAALHSRQQEGLYSISDYTGPPPDRGRPGRITPTGNAGASIPYRGLDGIPGMGNSGTSAPLRIHDSRPYMGHATSQETRPLVTPPYSRQAPPRPPAATPLLQEEPQEEDDLAAGPDSGFDSLGTTSFCRDYALGSQVPRQHLMGEDDFSNDSRFRSQVGLGYVPESSLSTFCPRQ